MAHKVALDALDWNTTVETHVNGQVVILQTKSDPGDMGEPRIFSEDGVTYICVPNFELWPRPADAEECAGDPSHQYHSHDEDAADAVPAYAVVAERLRAALKKVVESVDYERVMFRVRLPEGLLIDIEQARAILAAPSEQALVPLAASPTDSGAGPS